MTSESIIQNNPNSNYVLLTDQFKEIGALQAVANQLRARQDAHIEQDLLERYKGIKFSAGRERQSGGPADGFVIAASGIVMGALPDSAAFYRIRGDLLLDDLISADHMKRIDQISDRLAQSRIHTAENLQAHTDYIEQLLSDETEIYFDPKEREGDRGAVAAKLLAYTMGFSEGSVNPQFQIHSKLPDLVGSLVR